MVYTQNILQASDRNLVITSTAEQQKVRLMDRNDHFTEEEAQARVDSQLSIEEKRKRGDHVIDNTGLFSETGNFL